MKRNASKTTVVGRWHVAESADPYVPQTVVLFSNGTWTCSCAASKIADCRHILKAKGVKNSLTVRLVFVTISSDGGAAQVLHGSSPKESNQQPSGPIRKIDLE